MLIFQKQISVEQILIRLIFPGLIFPGLIFVMQTFVKQPSTRPISDKPKCCTADFRKANLSEANLCQAILNEARFNKVNFQGANLSEADLTWSILSEANLNGADLTACAVYAISAWGVQLENTIQAGLIITDATEPTITVDNLEMAQFIHLLLNNKKIRDVIDTIAKKGCHTDCCVGMGCREKVGSLSVLVFLLTTSNTLRLSSCRWQSRTGSSCVALRGIF